MTLPNFVVIGAPKAGTTALSRYLGDHRDGFVAAQKEVHYFDRDHLFARGVAWYEAQFEGAGGARAVGDATPGYMYSREAIDRMAALLPDARLIATLRNPVDRAYSQYWSNRSRGGDDRSFEEAMAGDATSPTEMVEGTNLSYAGRSRYLSHLQYVCERFDRSQLLVVLFEDLRDDPRTTYASVCQFLGIDDSYVPPTVGVPFGAHRAYRSVWIKRNLVKGRTPKGFRKILDKANTRYVEYEPLDDMARRRYAEMFVDDNVALAEWLQRDLHEWRVASNDPSAR